MKPLNTFGMTMFLSLATGCSAFRSSHQTLSVQVTDPPHAEVWVNRKFEGEAPVQVSVIRDHAVDITVKKEGFQPATQTVGYHINATGVLDIVGTYLFILPFIGIVAPGHDSLDETTVTMHLSPVSDAAITAASPGPAPAAAPSDTNAPTQ